MGRFENFTPIIEVDEITSAEETMLEELVALANSSSGQFIRKVAGSLVNATLSETIALSGLSDVEITSAGAGDILYYDGNNFVNLAAGSNGQILQSGGPGAPSWISSASGTVTSVSVVTANGVSGSVATSTTTPAITLTLGAITPTTVNGLTITANGTNTLNIAAGKILTVSNTLTLTATDGSTLAIGTGGTLGTAAYTPSTAYAAALGADDNYVTDVEKAALHAAGSDDTFTVANEAVDTTCFPLFVTVATGDLGPKTVATLTFNSNTGSLGATTFVGALTGDVTGNVSGTAATVTGAAQAAITSLGTLTNLDVDNININLNTISSTAGTDLLITPLAGQQIVLDGTIIIDAGEVTGATSITSTTFVGALTGTASGNLTSGGALGTPSSGTGTNITGIPAANILAGSFGAGAYVISTSLQVATMEIGHATDTTLSRSAAGVLAVEGIVIPSISSTNTLTNKRITLRTETAASTATLTVNSDNIDESTITAQAEALIIANPTGTPTEGQLLLIRVKDNATARAITYDAQFRGSTDVALPSTTVISKTIYMLFSWNVADSKWDILAKNNGF